MQNPKRILGRLALVAVAMAALLAGAPAARAQDEPTLETLAEGEITISCRWFGVGGVIRPGEWVGLRLGIADSASRPREIVVRVTYPRGDADGDIPLFERSITTNPGIAQPLWVYLRIPSRFGMSDLLNVAAYAAEEGGSAAQGARASLTAGKMLGMARLVRPNVTYRSDALAGIVGARAMGVRGYEGTDSQWLPAGHYRTRFVSRLDADTLPDRWLGLAPFDFIVWNEPSPTGLGPERAAAIREWVQRGGHLVVVLPRVGQAWTDQANNPLFDIVPRVRVTRREGVDLAPYRVLIDRRARAPMPTSEVLQTFAPLPEAAPEEAAAVIAAAAEHGGPGESLVVRRIVGTGMVTLVGLDVASRWMEINSRPDPELFWHRVLGRRGEIITGQELRQRTFARARDEVVFDGSIPRQIAKTGQAAAGVMLGFVVFVLYWLAAGPLGFAALKRAGMARHGWLAFVGAGAVFTAVAWGGATLIRPGRTEAKHLTIIDHVYGQNVDRSRTWLSLLVPAYGEATVFVGDPEARERSRFHNALAPWEPDAAGTEGFPDARRYRIDSRSPDAVTIPTRATVKQLQADWAGGPPWKMPRPVSPDPASPEGRVRVLDEEGAKSLLAGKLVHDLPADLTDVVIIVNEGQRDLARSHAGAPAGSFWGRASAYLIPRWRPQEILDLAALTADDTTSRGSSRRLGVEAYLGELLSSGRTESPGGGGGDETPSEVTRRLAGLALLPLVQPPEARDQQRFMESQRAVHRKYTHGMDLAAWMTQPCLIIVGHIGASEDEPSPTPLFISTGGTPRPLATGGRTVVRWVYPLAAKPPAYPDAEPVGPMAPPEEEEEPPPGGGA